MPKTAQPLRSDVEIRRVVHRWFYDRYKSGGSARGSRGVAAQISVVKRELKAEHQLTQAEVTRSLTYLRDQGWIRTEEEKKSYQTSKGTTVPSVATYYRITAAGVDKIEGEGEYTARKFEGINIEATGQNIITLGDNNQVDAKFETIAESLFRLKEAARRADDLSATGKLTLIADIETIQSQLAKAEPNPTVIATVWEGIEKLATSTSLAANVSTLGPLLAAIVT